MRTVILILMFAPLVVCSQTLHNNTSIFIPSSLAVHAGEVNNNGFIMNNGSMFVSGNWTNTNIYQGTGTIVLEGTDQFIENKMQSIHKLVIDGGGNKTISSTFQITGQLSLQHGIVHTEEDQILLMHNSAEIDGGSALSFVNGPLVIAGTGFKFVPVGINRHYYPVWLTDILGVDPSIQVDAHENVAALNITTPLESVNPVFWTQRVLAGHYQGSKVHAFIQTIPSDDSRVVFLEGNGAGDEFNLTESNGVFPDGEISVASSKETITKNSFTVASLPEEPVKPSYLSTTLSPNASLDVNRVIRMQGVDLVDHGFHFEVYNRWGNRIFETSSLDYMSATGWDGKQNGQQLPSGAYPYRVAYRDRTGKDVQETGFISIIY